MAISERGATFVKWHDVNDRYAAQLAPDVLHLTQAVANSFAHTPQDTDLLDARPAAQELIDLLAAEWASVHGGPVPRVTLAEADLPRLRRLRSTVRDLLLGEPGATLRAPVEVIAEGGRVRLQPAGRADGRWLEAAVGAELILAEQADQLRRLKLCRNAGCRVAFYDRSKNNSKVWHDVAVCGTPQRMREYRQRLHQAD